MRTEHQKTMKMCLTRLHQKIVVLPQCEGFSAYFAGRHSIPDLHDTKLVEGERFVGDL